MQPIPPEGFYPFKWKKRKEPHKSEESLYICPNCSAWFHYDNHSTRIDSSDDWILRECNWCKAGVWSSHPYFIQRGKSYYEPRPVDIDRNPLRHESFPDADLLIDPYGIIFPYKIRPELKNGPVSVDYPVEGFASPQILNSNKQIREVVCNFQRETEWVLADLVDSVWINYWTADVTTISLMYYDRWGYPTIVESRKRGWEILAFGHWHREPPQYIIRNWYRLDVLRPEIQYQWLKYAAGRHRYSTSTLEAFAQQHNLIFNEETRWDLQSSGQMTLF